jgi:AcrR family transcriptional regulator
LCKRTHEREQFVTPGQGVPTQASDAAPYAARVPPSTTRRHAHGAESRERILEAALDVASERGYHGTTVSLVTERSGLPTSSVYWHFGGKDALLAEALEHGVRRWSSAVRPLPSPDGADRHDLVARQFALLRDDRVTTPELWRLGLLLGLTRSPLEDAARSEFCEIRSGSREATASWLSSVRSSAGMPSEDARMRGVARLETAAADGMLLAAESARPWNMRRLTDSFARAVAAVALRSEVPSGSRRTARVPVLATTVPAPSAQRDRLVRAAAEVAAENGYAGTTVSRVCRRAGVGASSLYWSFNDKDALLVAVVQQSFDAWLDAQPSWPLATTAEQRVAALHLALRASVTASRTSPDFLRVGHLVSLEETDTDVAARTLFHRIRRQAENSITAWFAGSFAASPAFGDRELPRTLARLVVVVTDGLFLADQLGEGPGEDLVDLFVDVLDEVVAQRETELAGRVERGRRR